MERCVDVLLHHVCSVCLHLFIFSCFCPVSTSRSLVNCIVMENVPNCPQKSILGATFSTKQVTLFAGTVVQSRPGCDLAPKGAFISIRKKCWLIVDAFWLHFAQLWTPLASIVALLFVATLHMHPPNHANRVPDHQRPKL